MMAAEAHLLALAARRDGDAAARKGEIAAQACVTLSAAALPA